VSTSGSGYANMHQQHNQEQQERERNQEQEQAQEQEAAQGHDQATLEIFDVGGDDGSSLDALGVRLASMIASFSETAITHK
jgi:hypothetical protein